MLRVAVYNNLSQMNGLFRELRFSSINILGPLLSTTVTELQHIIQLE